MINLVQDPWIPVRRRNGAFQLIDSTQLTEDIHSNPIVGLAAARADFKGSLFQFLVALLQSTLQPDSEEVWGPFLLEPPSPDALQKAWEDLVPFFHLGGDGPRFMQDLDPLLHGSIVPISGLLMESPGENTVKNNLDHFIKRSSVLGLCPGCAAQALLTLQINAPSGGAGHRTSLRGGGPLSTFVLPDPRASILPHADSLWTQVWLNVLPRDLWTGGEPAPPSQWLPWANPTRTSEADEPVTPGDTHDLTAFWATPRRIRLNLEDTARGRCDLCGIETEHLVSSYRTRPRGANYIKWEHPHSPHRRAKPTEEWLPVHPQPGGLGYRHWPSMTATTDLTKPSMTVVAQFARTGARAYLGKHSQYRLWAFGYDMDNMKCRSYQESVMPLIEAETPESRRALEERASALVNGAASARNLLRYALKDAWFGEKGEVRGEFTFIESEFWAKSEPDFFRLMGEFAAEPSPSMDEAKRIQAMAETWQRLLVDLSLKLFDHWALNGCLESGNPHRVMEARRKLRGILMGAKFISQLGGAAPIKPERPRPRKGAKA